jgi:hypothetical protein
MSSQTIVRPDGSTLQLSDAILPVANSAGRLALTANQLRDSRLVYEIDTNRIFRAINSASLSSSFGWFPEGDANGSQPLDADLTAYANATTAAERRALFGAAAIGSENAATGAELIQMELKGNNDLVVNPSFTPRVPKPGVAVAAFFCKEGSAESPINFSADPSRIRPVVPLGAVIGTSSTLTLNARTDPGFRAVVRGHATCNSSGGDIGATPFGSISVQMNSETTSLLALSKINAGLSYITVSACHAEKLEFETTGTDSFRGITGYLTPYCNTKVVITNKPSMRVFVADQGFCLGVARAEGLPAGTFDLRPFRLSDFSIPGCNIGALLFDATCLQNANQSASYGWDISNNALGEATLNSFFDALPPNGNGVIINAAGNPGSSTCDSSIAIQKGYAVYV